jgi:hypothetical protein
MVGDGHDAVVRAVSADAVEPGDDPLRDARGVAGQEVIGRLDHVELAGGPPRTIGSVVPGGENWSWRGVRTRTGTPGSWASIIASGGAIAPIAEIRRSSVFRATAAPNE